MYVCACACVRVFLSLWCLCMVVGVCMSVCVCWHFLCLLVSGVFVYYATCYITGLHNGICTQFLACILQTLLCSILNKIFIHLMDCCIWSLHDKYQFISQIDRRLYFKSGSIPKTWSGQILPHLCKQSYDLH